MHKIINDIFNKYNYNQQLALKDYPNYLLRAFLPNTFLGYNFNINCDSPSDLWKFLDTMQKFTVNKYFKNDCNGYLTPNESNREHRGEL